MACGTTFWKRFSHYIRRIRGNIRTNSGGKLISNEGTETSTASSATLAEFPENMKKEAEWAYNFLFSAISQGKTAFDMTGYFPSALPLLILRPTSQEELRISERQQL